MDLHQSVVELEVLLARIARGDLDPGWTGTGAWDVRRQQLLVDTVVRSWPIPPIVVAGGEEQEVVLDGRERLLALWRFTRDELSFAGRPTAGGEYLEQLDGLRHGQLPERFRRRLQRYGVPVVGVPAQDDAEVRELMSRWRGPAPAAPSPRPAPAPRPTNRRVPLTPIETVPVPPPPAATEEPAVQDRPLFESRPLPDRPLLEDPPEGGELPTTAERPLGAHHRAADDEPIFDELSAWFLDVTGTPSRAGAHEPTFSSPADPVYDALRSALLNEPTPRFTPAGLPIRQPAAHLAPGAIDPPPSPRAPRPHDARAVGDHLSRLRHGTAAAREDLSHPGSTAASGY